MAVWLATQPLDMRAGTLTHAWRAWSAVFGGAHPHTAYLFANRRANRMKVLVHDGIGFLVGSQATAPGPLRLANP
jgi:transposase